MSPKNRNRENNGLPKRWRLKHGAYFYRVPPGLEHLWGNKKEFRLGSSLSEAHAVYASRIGTFEGELKYMEQLFERVLIEHLPKKAPKTQASYRECLKRLTHAFRGNPITAIRTTHCYAYRDAAVKQHGISIARHDLQVLSLSFTLAIEWAALIDHPIIGTGFTKQKPPPRTRYLEDWEIVEFLALKPKRKRGSVLMVQAYIRLKLLTGLRRTDMLMLNIPKHIRDDGIHITPNKTKNSTGKKLVIEWTPELRKAVDLCRAARPVDISPWMFCNGQGQPYIKEDGSANGFDSIWGRYVDRVLAETKVTEPFIERDLRAKCGSDLETLEHARQLLAHADSRITDQVYRRKPERVRPLR
jgi:integrase